MLVAAVLRLHSMEGQGCAFTLGPSRDSVLSLVHGSERGNSRPCQRVICLWMLISTSTQSNSLAEAVSRPLLDLECNNYYRNSEFFFFLVSVHTTFITLTLDCL